MFHPIFRTMLGRRHAITASPIRKLYFLQNPSLLRLKYFSKNADECSFAASYLINKCGLSPESAKSASKYLHFDTPGKPDSVLAFFKSHGFSNTQIADLVRRHPPIIITNPKKTLLPKVEFFYSLGFSSIDVAKILSAYPAILRRSLENQIIPSFNFFENLFQSHAQTTKAIKRSTALILAYDIETVVAPNINLLREVGVPERNIIKILGYQPTTILTPPVRFKGIVEEVKKMGFNPLRLKFVLATFAVNTLSKSKWERKFDMYKKWGWSEEAILAAFGKHPWCMLISEDKIMKNMDFFVKELGLEPSFIANRPSLLTLSLEKRIIPRGSVLKVLLSKGLIRKNFGVVKLFESVEMVFLKKFVNSHGKEASQLLKLYKEQLDVSRGQGKK